jgi:NDP-sugar pyrophosphorylase family protein
VPSLPALVLAAGLATRLRPLSLVRAKAALPVAGVPLASRVLRWLARHGIGEAVLNLHHLPETLTRLVGDGSQLGVRIRYSLEPVVLGTAGGPRHALPLLEGPRFVIINGDTLTDVDLPRLLAVHERSGALVTMALIANPDPARYGGVLVDRDRVAGFTSRGATGPNFHFIGVQVVEREVFEPLPDNVPTETVGQLYPALMRARPDSIGAFVSDTRFEDIGTPADYFATALEVGAREGRPGVQVGTDGDIDPGARLERSILWDRVVIERDVELVDCIVTDDARVTAGTVLNRRVIRRGSGDNLLIAPF